MALNDIQEQLRQLEQQKARIEERRAELEADLRRQAELEKKLDDIVESSGYGNARELVKALIEKYNLRLTGLRDAGVPEKTGRRKRTRITGDLRDRIKKEYEENGKSMNAAAKKFNISYAVVAKIVKGHYDNL